MLSIISEKNREYISAAVPTHEMPAYGDGMKKPLVQNCLVYFCVISSTIFYYNHGSTDVPRLFLKHFREGM